MIREKAGKLKYSDYFKKKRIRENRKRIVSAIAAIVVFVTTYSLILPAITLDVSRAGREPGVAFEQMQFRATASAASVTAADSAAEEVQVEEDSTEEPTEEETVEEDTIGDSEGKSSAASDNQEQEEAAAVSEREEDQETPAESDPEEEPAAETGETEEVRGDEGPDSKTDAASSSMSESSNEQAAVDRSGAGMTDDASAAASEEMSPEFQIPALDAIDFDDILTGETAFYYYHPENTDEAESLSSDSIDDWKKAGSDTVLAPQDFLRIYLSYEIPAGALNETNAEVRYRLPDVLQLSDRQIQTINGYENGIAASKSGSEHDKYLGAEAIEGSRTPDEKAGDEYISATVKVEKTNDDRQELVFTFIPYTIEKNQISYDATGKLTSEGRNVKGFFTFDLTTSQIDFENTEKETVEKEDGTTEEIQYSEAEVVFAEENKGKNTREISCTLIMAAPAENEDPQEQTSEQTQEPTPEQAQEAELTPEQAQEQLPGRKTLTSEGDDYTITVTCTEDAQIPETAELSVREIEKDSDEYALYLKQAKRAMSLSEEDEVGEARFFDIEITENGEKYEPASPVTVNIQYKDPIRIEGEDTLQIVHFADSGTEVITDVTLSDNGTELTYEQSSFSVSGVVVSGGSTSPADLASTVIFANEFHGVHTASFDINSGQGDTPSPQTVEDGADITFPENTSTRQGYVFIGWSEDRDATGSGVEHHRSAVYQPGDTFILNENKTFYAVWAKENVTSSFYIRLDGRIPHEPASKLDGAYPVAEYTRGVTITNVLKQGRFYANTTGVDSNLNSMPTADQLVAMINADPVKPSSARLGFKAHNDDGRVIVSEITDAAANSSGYNVSVGDELYVIWYVTKHDFAGPVLPGYQSNKWHVDGVLLTREKVNLIYDANAPAGVFSNMPLGSQWWVDSDVVVGNDGGDNESVKQPVRSDGYSFTEWKMYTRDGDGNYTVERGAYATNDHFTITEDTLLVAQWEKGKTPFSIVKKDQTDSAKLLAGAQFRLTGFSETDQREEDTITNASGRASFRAIEFDTLYKLEETEAPTGYTALENPIFFKETKVGTRYVVTFYTDQTGTQITDPDDRVFVSVTGTALELDIDNIRDLGKAEFIKTGETSDVKLEGAKFQLFTDITCETYAGYTSESGADGKVSFTDLPTDTYYMKEIEAPEGYELSDDIYQVVVNKEDFTIKKVVDGAVTGDAISEISNKHVPVEIRVHKVDETDPGKSLGGAVFKLTRSEDGTSGYTGYPDSDHCTFETDANGVFTVSLPKGYYRLTEITPPPGYVITTGGFDFSVSDGTITFSDTGKITFSAVNKTFTVANEPGAELPHTGGPGTALYTLGGFTFIFTSLLMNVFRMRRKERRIN